MTRSGVLAELERDIVAATGGGRVAMLKAMQTMKFKVLNGKFHLRHAYPGEVR
jgi:hypothetical protein